MKNIIKSLIIVLGCLATTLLSAQTTVTWTPTQADVTALTNTSIHYVDVGTGTKSFKIYSIRPFLNTNAVKLEWDASKNAVKMTDNGMEKAGIAIYVPTTSDNISKIVVYMHTTGSRKTYYTSGNPCPTSTPSTYTTTALATTPTAYEFWTGTLSKDMYYACGGRKDGSGDSYFDKVEVTFAGLPPASNDATLSALVYGSDQTSVDNFSPSQTSYEVELPATYVGSAPTIQGTLNDANASITDVSQATSIPGTASITVTAQDGTTTKTYTVHFTRESAEPKVLTATWDNIFGTAVIDQDNKTITGQVTNGSSLTLTPQFTGKNIDHWTPEEAQDFSTGDKNYVFISSTTESTQYTVSITEAPAMSSDATLSSLTYGGTSVPSFSPTTYVYNIELTNGIKTPPTIAATANDSKANVNITQAQSVPGSGNVVVTAEDGTQLTYTINYTVPVPVSGLTLHEPEVFEAKAKAGGYGGKLTSYNGHDYEVYYAGRWDNSGTKLTIHIDPVDKSQGVTKNETGSSYEAIDGWFTGTGSDKGTGFAVLEEFEKATSRCHTISSSNSVELRIKGYDQFALYGADKKWNASKPSDCKYLKVLIDNVEQTMTPSTDQTIRRFNFASTEHVIKIIHSGGEQSLFGGFSLREAQVPRVKHFKGNDSSQVVMQTTAFSKVVYTCKYNNLEGAETNIVWDGPEANGITLSEKKGDLTDTLSLIGIANCPVGIYKYAIVSTLNGAETSRVSGTFEVKSDIRATSGVKVEAYQNEEMDQITFRYYALSANNVRLTWPQSKPQGVDGFGTQQPGEYIIGGTPTTIGTYPFAITVEGADTIINGVITVKELHYGDNAVLFLYKNDSAYNKDGVYNYLKAKNVYNPITRKAKRDGLRPSDQYSNYKWVLISEDVDADNPEILALARGEGNLPVLSMKAFSYTEDRLNWGEPNNGSLSDDEGRFITVVRDDHPIFKALNKKKGDRIQVLESTGEKGLMPISVNYTGTICLATAHTRDMDDYYGDGYEETFLHEIPAEMHRNQKYLCLPIGQSGSNYLHEDGKRLIDECIKYILGNDATIKLPDLAINQIQIGSYTFVPEKDEDKIVIEVFAKDSDMLKAATPVVALASPMTFAYPTLSNEDGTVNLSNWQFGLRYIVSDYINKRGYDIVAHLKAEEGIDEIEAGEWINIFDIYGRKVATTNEDLRTMDLPRGMYIVITESGKTLKIMR